MIAIEGALFTINCMMAILLPGDSKKNMSSIDDNLLLVGHGLGWVKPVWLALVGRSEQASLLFRSWALFSIAGTDAAPGAVAACLFLLGWFGLFSRDPF